MKPCFIPVLFVCSLLIGITGGCSTDLDLNAEYEDIPIIYGLLDVEDSTHYVRIQKAFLGQKSAQDIAGNHDSLYYDHELDVTVRAVNDNGEPNGATYNLERLNGDTLGLPKDEGMFAEDPNELYRFKGQLNPNATYKLTMTNPKSGKTVSAITKMVQDFEVKRPLPNNSNTEIPVRFQPERSEPFKWDAAPNGKVNELLMRFRYFEWPKGSPGQKEAKHFTWRVINRELTDAGQQEHEVKKGGIVFFSTVSDQLEADPSIRRAVDTVKNQKFTYNVGAEDLYNYVRVGEAQTGITELQVTPQYSNFDEGLGILSSVYTKELDNIKLADKTIDSLACNTLTKELNFRNSKGAFDCE